ncbi:hypothetical protein [Oligosphaera ethanolica]|uniref:Uncharacterized protein n=1 Tax=Oligosphaera ethanolica TaxID=760260 RepID=A0AAE3VDS2_9BACT|nr:hypothetical protein [Oligosphaera ethanolica]MDQ0288526.1 hypothetical protein [Oligosphaera ethanolica]
MLSLALLEVIPKKAVSNHPGGENTGDNLQETHGQPPLSQSTLISADLCGSGVIAAPE